MITNARINRSDSGFGDRGYHLGRRVTVLLVVLGFAAGCGLPPDDRVTTINRNDLSESLANPTTTSTTLPPPPTVPPPSGPDRATTTIELIETKVYDIFYGVQASGSDIQRLRRNLPVDISIDGLIGQLESPLPELITTFNLQSSVRPGLVGTITLSDGAATVPLDEDELDRLTGTQQRRAISQLVLTLTSFVTANRGAIGSVQFTVNDEGISVFVPSLLANGEPGEPLSFDDFSVLVIGAPPPPARTTTTTTTTSSTIPSATTLPDEGETSTTTTVDDGSGSGV